MSRKLPLLQKKMYELEAALADAFRCPQLDPTATVPGCFHDFNKRFLFLQKLLSAELISHPEASDQLGEIQQRLAGLQAALRDWSQPTNIELISHDDTPSVCSDCTQALLYDDDSPIAGGGTFCCKKSPEKCSGCEEVEEKESVTMEAADRRSRDGIWKYCAAFGCGVVIGAVSVIKLYSSSLQFMQFHELVVPPT